MNLQAKTQELNYNPVLKSALKILPTKVNITQHRFLARPLLPKYTTRWQDCKIKIKKIIPIMHSVRAASRTPCWEMTSVL